MFQGFGHWIDRLNYLNSVSREADLEKSCGVFYGIERYVDVSGNHPCPASPLEEGGEAGRAIIPYPIKDKATLVNWLA